MLSDSKATACTCKCQASQGELKTLREEAVLLRQRAQTLASAHEHMSLHLSLALYADGLSERMQEARQGRRELEQASLTIMQMDAKIRLLSSAKGQTDEKVCVCVCVCVCTCANACEHTAPCPLSIHPRCPFNAPCNYTLRSTSGLPVSV